MLKDSVTKVTITSAANRSFHHLQSLNSEKKNSHLLETPFSSYLDRNGGTFEKKLADSSKTFNYFTSNREDDLVHVGKKKGEEEEEIGVFSAEKYFNGVMEDSPRVSNNRPARKGQHHSHHHPPPNQKEKQEADLEEPRKSKVLWRKTPSVHSESSWNSQSALLKTALKNSSRNNRKKVQGKSLLASLGCKCYCSDKDSVDVRSTTSGEISFRKNASFSIIHAKTSSPKKSFETAYSGLENQLVNMQLQPEYEEEEKPRKSLEVFGSPIFESRSKSLSFDKRLTNPSSSSSWNHHVAAAPKSEEIDLSTNPGGGNYINDAASDASSDLFEIESFTGAKPKPYLARQASDTANSGCVTPTTCYAPSEASIEWSVATASAAEYSILSDYEDQRSVADMRSPFTNGKSKANRDMQRRRSGNLLGCKSHKAVRVAGDAFIRNQKSSPNFPQMTKMASFDPRHGGQHAYGSQHSRQRSHSQNASQLLYV